VSGQDHHAVAIATAEISYTVESLRILILPLSPRFAGEAGTPPHEEGEKI